MIHKNHCASLKSQKDRDQPHSIYLSRDDGKQLHRPAKFRASLWPWCRYGVPFNRLTGMKEHSTLRPGGGRQGQRQGCGRSHQSQKATAHGQERAIASRHSLDGCCTWEKKWTASHYGMALDTKKRAFLCQEIHGNVGKNLKIRWLVVSAAMVWVGVHSEHLAPENPHNRRWNAVADGTELAPTTTGTRITTIGKLP